MEYAMKTGIGAYAAECNGIQVGAVVVLNALGDVFIPETGQKIAGLLAPDKKSFSAERTVQTEFLKIFVKRRAKYFCAKRKHCQYDTGHCVYKCPI